MLTNGSPHTRVPAMRGTWRGYFICGSACGPSPAGTQHHFLFNFDDLSQGNFRGTGNPDHCNSPQGHARIEGNITEERVIFSIEDDFNNFRGIFKGKWDAEEQQFHGTWRTPLAEGDLFAGTASFGEWIMEFDQPLQHDAGRFLSFPVRYEEEHFHDIYLSPETEKAYKHNGWKFLSLAILLLLPVCWMLQHITLDSSATVLTCLFSLVAGGVISLLLFVRQLLGIRKWKRQVLNSIANICSEPDFRITIDGHSVCVELLSGSTLMYWNEVTECRINPKYIQIQTDDLRLIIPRASVRHHDFAELTTFLQANAPVRHSLTL